MAKREEINVTDKWNLASLFENDAAFEKALAALPFYADLVMAYKGRLKESPTLLAEAMDALTTAETHSERLAYYAMLRTQENLADQTALSIHARYLSIAALFAEKLSFFRSEILSLNKTKMAKFMRDPALEPYAIYLKRMFRFKKHTLSAKEERLMARLGELEQTPSDTFAALTNVDFKFDTVATPEGAMPLTQASFPLFLKHKDRTVRADAYKKFYAMYSSHQNTVASLFAGSIKQDLFNAQIRNFKSAREASLFEDDVPLSLYDSLVQGVRDGLPVLHGYYALRKKKLGLDKLRHYDLHVPIVKEAAPVSYPFETGVDLICQALAPLGDEYVSAMRAGLLGGWVDRYENEGKHSGAFSAGSYRGNPYILINYKENDIRSLFTLAHEAGHSMHSYYSVRNNPFQHYNYSIFEAEVASTLNESLLFEYLIKHEKSDDLKNHLIGERASDIVSTLFRQTMFAEFEHILHAKVEAGGAVTLNLIREIYRSLLVDYFGPDMEPESESDLEGLRIPHFYRAFYVYKYATGISASLALSKQILAGGEDEKARYLSFLKSGGSQFPLESLRLAGVDMSSTKPVTDAIASFSILVDALKKSV